MTYYLFAYLPEGGKVFIKNPRSLNKDFAITRAKALQNKRKCVCEVVAQGKGVSRIIYSSGIVDIDPFLN